LREIERGFFDHAGGSKSGTSISGAAEQLGADSCIAQESRA